MKRLILSLVCMMIFTVSADRGAYETWFSAFMNRLNDSHTILTDKDKKELTELLNVKPSAGTGRFYQQWFEKAFLPYIEDSMPVLSDEKQLKIDFIMQAMPDTKTAGDSYPAFLAHAFKMADDYMPVLTIAERKVMDYYRAALPKTVKESDYELWFTRYNEVYEDFGPVYSDTEKYVLDFFKQLKPDQNQGPGGKMYEVSEETLLKIRYLILGNTPYQAVKEIDSILESN